MPLDLDGKFYGKARKTLPKYGPKNLSMAGRKKLDLKSSGKRARTGSYSVSGSGDYRLIKDGVRQRTPFADVGRHLGGYAGMGDLGYAAGHLIGTAMGSGDYRMSSTGHIVNANTPPAFKSDRIGNIVRHREFIQDVVTGAAGSFDNNAFALNPGLAQTFPWLAVVAQNYEQYEIHGMIFEYKTTSSDALNSTNTALGTVIMATSYNSPNPVFTNKQDMENYEYAQSAKPSVSQLHGIECAASQTPVKQLFVRTGAVPAGQDQRWFDMGVFQLATVGFQASNVVIGELWVTYEIEFLKPRIPLTLGGNIQSFHFRNSACTGANPLGLGIPTNATGSLFNSRLDSTGVIQFNNVTVNSQYYIYIVWTGGAVVTASPILSFAGDWAVSTSGCTAKSGLYSPYEVGSTFNSTKLVLGAVVTSDPRPDEGICEISIGVAGTLPSAAVVDVFVFKIDDSCTN